MTVLFVVLIGLVFGSFINVVASRGPFEWGLVEGDYPSGHRSRCPHCGATIAWYDLIPVVSFVVLRAKCRVCDGEISFRYPITELACAGLFLLCFLIFGVNLTTLLAWIFSGILLALWVIDFETGFLPDALTIPLLLIGISANLVDLFVPAPDALLGCAIAYVGGEALRVGYRSLRGREGLGGGDPKLLAAIGAWTGASALPLVLFFASVGTLVVVAVSSGLKDGTKAVPFGPGLATAGALVFLLRDWLERLSVL
ncbi:MAG: prepilin peptidase [Pseudomonadota bacterium]